MIDKWSRQEIEIIELLIFEEKWNHIMDRMW